MTQHTARVIAVQDPRTIPDTDDEQAIEVLLEGGTSIYLELGSPHPGIGETIIWEGGKAWVRGVQCRKRGYAFESGRPLR